MSNDDNKEAPIMNVENVDSTGRESPDKDEIALDQKEGEGKDPMNDTAPGSIKRMESNGDTNNSTKVATQEDFFSAAPKLKE